MTGASDIHWIALILVGVIVFYFGSCYAILFVVVEI